MWKYVVLGFEPMTYGSESECATHYTTAPHHTLVKRPITYKTMPIRLNISMDERLFNCPGKGSNRLARLCCPACSQKMAVVLYQRSEASSLTTSRCANPSFAGHHRIWRVSMAIYKWRRLYQQLTARSSELRFEFTVTPDLEINSLWWGTGSWYGQYWSAWWQWQHGLDIFLWVPPSRNIIRCNR